MWGEQVPTLRSLFLKGTCFGLPARWFLRHYVRSMLRLAAQLQIYKYSNVPELSQWHSPCISGLPKDTAID